MADEAKDPKLRIEEPGMTPEQAKAAWDLLMMRVRDLAADAYLIAVALNRLDKEANGRSCFVGEQVAKATKLCDDLTKFHTTRVTAVGDKSKEKK